MSPTDITQTENEGGRCNKSADRHNPEMPAALVSKPEMGSWHESERETRGSQNSGHGVRTPWATDLPHQDHVLPERACAHYSSLSI